jgi:MarR family transcriptional regulator, organic hydroperoxide resistance regulator
MVSTRTKTKSELATELTAAIHRIGKVSKRAMRADLDRIGLTVPQAIVLNALASGKRMSARDLGRECDMLASTATGVVDRLEQHGLVIRERDADDRRVVWIDLTAEGRALQASLPQFGTHFTRALQVLSARELEQMIAAVHRAAAALEEEEGR